MRRDAARQDPLADERLINGVRVRPRPDLTVDSDPAHDFDGPDPFALNPDSLHVPEPDPPRHELIHRDGWIVCSAPDCSYMRQASPRRSGCLSVLPWLALILVWVLW